MLKHMFYISLSFIKRKNLGEVLERDGLKTEDARSGLGISLGCRDSGPMGGSDSDAVWELGDLGVTLGAVSPALTGRTPGERRLKPVPLGQRLFGAEDVRYRTSRVPRQPPALVQT